MKDETNTIAANTASGEFSAEARPVRGANIPRKKSVLGRGLQALMSPTAVPVERPIERPIERQFERFADSLPVQQRTSAESVQGNAAEPEETRQSIAESLPAKPPLSGAPVWLSEAAAPEVRQGYIESRRPLSEDPQLTSSEGAPEGLLYIPLDRIVPNKAQPRQFFPQDEIDRLADSVRKTGLLQPILVRRREVEGGALPTYEIIAGERRWRAARQSGLVKVPAILRQLTDREALELGIVENVQRSDLNPIEEALAYYRLAEEFGANQSEIADKVGKDRASIANSLRLLKLSEDVQKLLVSGVLSSGHGRALLAFTSPAEQLAVATRIVEDGLSVREIERLAAEERAEAKKPTKPLKSKQSDNQLTESALEERLRRGLGTKVKLRLAADGSGEVKISFFSSGELESLLDRLKV